MSAAILAAFIVLLQAAAPATAPTPQTGEIRGRVVDSAAGHLPGATVIARALNPLSRPAEVQTLSRQDGSYRLPELGPGPYRLIVALRAFRTSVTLVTVVASKVSETSVTLQMAAIIDCNALGRTGSVRSRSGIALPDAVVTVTAPAHVPYIVRADVDGRFGNCLHVTAEDTVSVSAAGFGTHVAKASGVNPDTVNWDLVLDFDPAVLGDMARSFVPATPSVTLWPGEVVVGVATTMGDFMMAVDTTRAPITSANFLKYVDAGLYDSGRFHRATRPDNYKPVPPNRPMMEIIQGGINQARRSEGFSAIPLERTSVTGIRHAAGVVSMARGTGADTATSDFFVLLDDQPSLDFGGKRFDDGQGGAAFGRIVSGLDVVRRIQQQPVQGQNLTPPVSIIAIRRVR